MELIHKFQNSGKVKKRASKKQTARDVQNTPLYQWALAKAKDDAYTTDPKGFYDMGSTVPQVFRVNDTEDTDGSLIPSYMIANEVNVFPNEESRNNYLKKLWDDYRRERQANSVWSNAVSKGLEGPTAAFWEKVATLGIGGSMAVTAALPMFVEMAKDLSAGSSVEEMARVGQNLVNFTKSYGPQGVQLLNLTMQQSGPQVLRAVMQTANGGQKLAQMSGLSAAVLEGTQAIPWGEALLGTLTAGSIFGAGYGSQVMLEDEPQPVLAADDSPAPIIIGGTPVSTAEPEPENEEDKLEENKPEEKPLKKSFRQRLADKIAGNKPSTPEQPALPSSNHPVRDWFTQGWNKPINYIKPWKPLGLLTGTAVSSGPSRYALLYYGLPAIGNVFKAIWTEPGDSIKWFQFGKQPTISTADLDKARQEGALSVRDSINATTPVDTTTVDTVRAREEELNSRPSALDEEEAPAIYFDPDSIFSHLR